MELRYTKETNKLSTVLPETLNEVPIKIISRKLIITPEENCYYYSWVLFVKKYSALVVFFSEVNFKRFFKGVFCFFRFQGN